MGRKTFAAALGALALVAGLAGCKAFPYANQTVTALVTSVEGTTVVAQVIDEEAMGATNGMVPEGAAPGGTVNYERQADAVFEVGDESVYATDSTNLHPTTTGADAQRIRLEDGSIAEAPDGVSLANGTLTIANAGTYSVSGDFRGLIDVTATDEVQLQLNGLSLTGSDATLLRSAGNLVLELGRGTNTIASNGTYEGEDDVTPLVDCQGALFIEGSGSLDLTAGGHALSAQTMLAVDDGELSVKSGEDALFSASDLRISGGTLSVDAGDDVAHGDLVLVLEGGEVNGQGKEGLEAERIYLRDGSATLDTSDDGINAAEPEAHDEGGAPEGYSEAENCLIAIGGGTITIDAKGDGIDSNGSVEVRGGETYVNALAPGSGEANAPLDYDGAAVLTGGTMLLLGDGSMGQGFTEADQAYVFARATGSAGQQVVVEGPDGQILASHTADQAFDVVIATAPDLESGQTVQVKVGDTTTEATATTEAIGGMGGPDGALGAAGNATTGDANVQPPEPPSGDANQQGRTPPEPPTGDGQGQQGTPPEPPSGDGNQQGGTPPEPPTGDASQQDQQDQQDQSTQGTAPETNNATDAGTGAPTPKTTGEEITFNVEPTQAEQLVAGDIVTVTFDANGAVTDLQVQGPRSTGLSMGHGPAMGNASAEDLGTAATTFDSDQTVHDENYESTEADQNAIRVTNGAIATLGTLGVTKTGDSTNTDASNFYGLNAAILVNDRAEADIADTVVESDGQGANGIFASGTGSKATISNTKIRTSGDNSGGVMCAGGASVDALDLDVETEGKSSAAIRSDRGGGTMELDGGSYVTHGSGSPAIYSTADIAVKDATLTATGSEGVVVEGANSVTLADCELAGTMQNTYGADSGENLQAVMIYQSMSGDAEVGGASFDAKGGSITSGAGDLFYMTNTTGSIFLEDVDLTLADGALLRVAGNSGGNGSPTWGQSGANGGDCTFDAKDQQLKGDIVVDEISSLDFRLGEGSTFEGAINADGQAGGVKVLLNGGTWTLTADSYITSYEGDLAQVNANGHHLFVNGEQVL